MAKVKPAKRLTVLVPTLNEEECIGTVLKGLLKQEGVDEILMVDGGSTDRTCAIAEELGVKVLVQTGGRGLGVGLHQGFAATEGELIGIVDADGSHDWTDIPAMIRLIDEGADYVLASRYIGPFRWRGIGRWPWSTSDDDTLIHEWGNLGIVALAKIMHGFPLHDMMMGLQIWRRSAMDTITLEERGQVFDVELKLKLHRAGFKLAELSSHEPKRIGGEAKLHAVTDGIDVARVLLKEWIRGGFRRVKANKG